MAKKRTNVVPIIEDARKPAKYRMICGMVDCIFADVAQPDQARIIIVNAEAYLKNGGGFVFSIKVNHKYRLTASTQLLHQLLSLHRKYKN